MAGKTKKAFVEKNYYERLELTEEADAEAVKKVRRNNRKEEQRQRRGEERRGGERRGEERGEEKWNGVERGGRRESKGHKDSREIMVMPCMWRLAHALTGSVELRF